MPSFLDNPAGVLRFVRYIPLLVVLMVPAGCGTYLGQYYFGDLFGKGSSTADRGAEQLAADGMQAMKDEDYSDALEAFQQLKERYPYSKYAMLAELKLGDARFHNKEYAEAAMAYEEFARLHPRNEVVPYVLYQIGMCHFLGFSTIDRDQEETRAALDSFQRLIQTFPESEYARRGKKQAFECQKRLVAHEYYVGRFYFRREAYKSSKERLEKIAAAYPEAVKELGYEDKIAKMLSECGTHIGEGEKKPSVWSRMGF